MAVMNLPADAMASAPSHQVPESPEDAGAQPWPSHGAAWYALIALTVATMLNFLDANVFALLIERIKHDLLLSDDQIGWLLGPANILFYLLVGIPLARLVDIYPRKLVLGAGLLMITCFNTLSGLAQGFAQLFGTRMLVGAGGSAHAPGAYSMLSDFFPPSRLPRAFAVLQLGYIGGSTLGPLIGGQLLAVTSRWGTQHWLGLTIYDWQQVLLILAIPGFICTLMLLLIREPERRGTARGAGAMPIRVVLAEIWARRAVYFPLFIGLAFSATESLGIQAWRVPLLARSYGWNETQIGNWSAPMLLVSWVAGLFVGTATTEWLSKRHKDAYVRTTVIMFALAVPCAVLAPLAPNGVAALALYSLSGMFGIASAIPQNAAIQRITPNQMRGQVTAVYLFMFIFFGAMGSLVIGLINQHLFGNPNDLWKSMALTAAVLMPLATVTIAFGVRPYGREVERLEALEGTA